MDDTSTEGIEKTPSALASVAQGWSANEWSFDALATRASEALQELNNVDVRAMAEIEKIYNTKIDEMPQNIADLV